MACAIPVSSHRWPNGIIFYEINSNVNATAVETIYDAMSLWEDDTNIRFVRRTSETDFTEFITNAALGFNRSEVGRKGGRQTVELKEQPGYGSVLPTIRRSSRFTARYYRCILPVLLNW
jgi:Astacin (Peptidase family M12A)